MKTIYLFLIIVLVLVTRISSFIVYELPYRSKICGRIAYQFQLRYNVDEQLLTTPTLSLQVIKLHSSTRRSGDKINDKQNQYDKKSEEYETTETNLSDTSRRHSISKMMYISGMLPILCVLYPHNANAAFGLTQQQKQSGVSTTHRQLELCLVILLRVIYWAKLTIDLFVTATEQAKEQRQKLYLEARLCAKSMLTGKLGDGSTSKVYSLSSLRVPSCLSDIEWYAQQNLVKNKSTSTSTVTALTKREYDSIINSKTTLYEGLASIVEFDGLDTLIDPSPRATLTAGQYTEQKFLFVKRTIVEIIIPSAIQIVTAFGSQPLHVAEQYTQTYYKDEVYNFTIPTASTTSIPVVQPSPGEVSSQETTGTSPTSTSNNNDEDYDGSY